MRAQAGTQIRRCGCGDPSTLDSRFHVNDRIRKPVTVKYATAIANGGIKFKFWLRLREFSSLEL